MSMKNQWLLSVAMVLLAWSSLPFLGLRNIKRFLPASILVLLMGIIDVQIGKKRRWWIFYNKPHSYISNEFPYHIGPFLVGSMWILKWTYGNFKNFIKLNAIIDAIFAVPISSLCKNLKVYRRVWLNEFQFFLYFFYKSLFLYGFQYFFENKKELTRFTNKDRKNCRQEIVQP